MVRSKREHQGPAPGRQDGSDGYDAIIGALRGAGFGDVIAVRLSGSPAWGFDLDVNRPVAVVAVTWGASWLRQPHGPSIGLIAGDLVLLPTARPGHGLASTPHGGPLMTYDEVLARARSDSGRTIQIANPSDGTPATTRPNSIIYAACRPDGHTDPVLAGLPPAILVRANAHQPQGRLDQTLHMLSAELDDDHPGSQAAIERLVELLVINTLRAAARPEASYRRSVAPIDAALMTVLSLVEDDPSRQWTITKLAAEVGLSRAAFARHFTALIGEPPSTYVTRIRLAAAARLLRTTDRGLWMIARQVGYSSEFTFSRAFTRVYGLPPGRYRLSYGP